MFNVSSSCLFYKAQSLFLFDFNTCNSPNVQFYEITHIKQSYIYTIYRCSLKWRFTSNDRDLIRNMPSDLILCMSL